ncbi:hypothetical protein [Paraburkholderia diazotrophica]|uniref:hypothetical protein n=1 Tax=Paraburkholderia diazotrophica TaxID=667676 RepID=UPI00115FF6D8|nr:hypothetical protein [Paraburkholderia diazotrophica]
MDVMIAIFGEGRDFDALQVRMRTVAVFFVGLLCIRFSVRRCFGLSDRARRSIKLSRYCLARRSFFADQRDSSLLEDAGTGEYPMNQRNADEERDHGTDGGRSTDNGTP